MNINIHNSAIETFIVQVSGKEIKFDRYFVTSNFFNIINTEKPPNNAKTKEKNRYNSKILFNEKLMVVIKNVQVNTVQVYGEELKKVFRDLQNHEGSKKYIKTKNQHYLKKSIQKKWENKSTYVFNLHGKKAIGTNTPIYKHLSYNETNLLNANQHLVISDFGEGIVGAENNTYTLFLEDTIIFIEGLLVNRIEDFMENLLHKKTFNNIDKNMVLFLVKSNFKNRIYTVQKIAYTIFENKIDDFYKNLQIESDIKISQVKLEKDTFNLHTNWSIPFYPAFFLGFDCSIMPLTPREAIIISYNDSDKHNELISIIKNMEQFYFDINSYAFEIYNLQLQKEKYRHHENSNISESTFLDSGNLCLYRKDNIIRATHLEFIENIVKEDLKNMTPIDLDKSIVRLLLHGEIYKGFLRSVKIIESKIYNDYQCNFIIKINFEQLFRNYYSFYITDFD